MPNLPRAESGPTQGIVQAFSEDELFPPQQRVYYRAAPLIEVVCQVQFPTILKIGAAQPADFQERVRERFPLFETESVAPSDLPKPVAELLGVEPGSRAYRFRSDDAVWTLSLTNDFLALSTSKYTRWEQFNEMLQAPLSALQEIYRPSFFSRIGLRYIDAIVPSRLGLPADMPWHRLLKPHIVSELAHPQIAETIQEAKRRLSFVHEQSGAHILLQHGLRNVKLSGEQVRAYFIDFDFFRPGRTETQDAGSILNRFNAVASCAFRWCITDELHAALQPEAVRD